MSSEPRLRERLDRATSRLEPDACTAISTKRSRAGAAGWRCGASAPWPASRPAIVPTVVGGPRLLRSLPDDEVPISPGPTATVPPVDIDGT